MVKIMNFPIKIDKNHQKSFKKQRDWAASIKVQFMSKKSFTVGLKVL